MVGTYNNPNSVLDGLGVRTESKDLVDTAVSLAATAHAGQKDKLGEPYILHVLRVGLAGETDNERIVGFLHDTIEDTDVKLPDLIVHFDAEILNAINAITRHKAHDYKQETYAEYIERVALNPLARAVKLNDLRDNLSRVDRLLPEDAARLGERYRRALARLGESARLSL